MNVNAMKSLVLKLTSAREQYTRVDRWSNWRWDVCGLYQNGCKGEAAALKSSVGEA